MKLLLVLLPLLSVVRSAKILAFFYFPSISHQYVFNAIAKELSLRGHQVTFVSPNIIEDSTLTNLTAIDISAAYGVFNKYDFTRYSREHMSLFNIITEIDEFTKDVVEIEMNTEDVMKLMEKPADSFDLILIETHSPIFFGLQYKFKAPLIALSSLNVYSHMHHLMGNPIHPVLYPDIFSESIGPVRTLKAKIDSLYVNFIWWFAMEFFSFPRNDAVARSYFGVDMPYIRDMIKQTSLLLLNINPIFSDKRPMVPNVIDYFNVHLERKETLPEDLQKILDKAENGAVYFSLGTNVRLGHVDTDIKTTILDALGELPYTVLCKWESEDHPKTPKNVILRKWFPQQSILAHKNVKVFVTQGGLQSSEEAISNGVPVVVIPFLGDQPLNAQILADRGIAEIILPKHLNKQILRESILKVATDEKYRQTSQELRSIFLDQPQSGLEKIVWWCEYVIRHKGAKHLRSPGADITLYEYFMLDVLLISFVIPFIIYKLTRSVLRIL